MEKLYPFRRQLALVLQSPMVKWCQLLQDQQHRSQGLLDSQHNPTEKLYPFRRQLAPVLQFPMVKWCQLLQCQLLQDQQHRSQGLLDSQHNPMDKLYPSRRQLAPVLQFPMVKLCQRLQIVKLLHSFPGPALLAQLRQVSQRKAQLPLLLRATPLLQGPLRRPLFLHLNNLPARGRIPSHQLVMILRRHKSFQRASYTDRRRRRLRLKAIISDLPAFLLMCLKFCTRTVALARNLPTQEWSI